MYLYGASGHAKVIIEILELCDIKVAGLFDDNPKVRKLLNYYVKTFSNEEVLKNEEFIISVGDNTIRKNISKRLNYKFGIAIHPNSTISKSVKIKSGTVIMGNSIINADSKIGRHAIINTSASIDHDCIIEDFVHISPNSTLCGNVTVGEGTQIGAGATIIPGVKIGSWSLIGAGAVIIRDVPDHAVVVGNPGKIIKFDSK